MNIQIGKDELELSERRAKDVLDLNEYHEKNKSDSPTYNLVIMATVIESSLRVKVSAIKEEIAGLKRRRWHWLSGEVNQKIKSLKLELGKYSKYDVQYLLSQLSQHQLLEIYFKVLKLEGVNIEESKKKVKGKRSAGLSQKPS